MASTNITSVNDHSEHLTPKMGQPNLRPSKEETIGFNLSMGSTLPGNNSLAAAMVNDQYCIVQYASKVR